MSEPAEYQTVDGVSLRVGDTVWRSMSHYRSIRKHKVTKTDLVMWWSMVKSELFSTERSAVRAAIEREKRNLARARREVRNAEARIDDLTNRLRGLR